MTATFDLIYVRAPQGNTVSGVVRDSEGDHMIGPFPAAEAGPKIADTMTQFAELGVTNRKDAESMYMMRHFANMSAGVNLAGIDYPTKLESAR